VDLRPLSVDSSPRNSRVEDRTPTVLLLTLGFVVFWIGGTLFHKSGIDRSPGEVASFALGAHALTVAGITLMAAGGLLMLAAGF